MARPVTIDDAAILAAAREVFLEHGVRGTTAEVASRAGVSEGSVFKRWRTKEDLFQAAMNSDRVADASFLVGLMERVGQGDLREQWVEIGILAGHFFEKIAALHMHRFAGGSHDPQRQWSEGEPAPLAARKMFAGYLEAERHAGRLRNVDTDVLARTFLGAIFNFVSLEMMMRGREPHPMPLYAYVRGLVDIVLEGVAAPAKPPKK
ncbi:MAG: TetR/AcrR family transcriptional regulator [Sandaracinus sp.]